MHPLFGSLKQPLMKNQLKQESESSSDQSEPDQDKEECKYEEVKEVFKVPDKKMSKSLNQEIFHYDFEENDINENDESLGLVDDKYDYLQIGSMSKQSSK